MEGSDTPQAPTAGTDQVDHALDQDHTIIARVGIKVPDFWRAEPELWFLRLEAQFRQARIASDGCKFDHTVASLNSDVLIEVSDILRNPISGRAYNDLKTRLLDRYGTSNDEKIHRLMEMTLGDLKPSQLLHRMQAFALDNISTQVLKNLWLDRLPSQVRGVISILDGDLEELAKKADKFTLSANSPIMPIETKTSMEKVVTDLTNQISALATKVETNQRYSPPQQQCDTQGSSQSVQTTKTTTIPDNDICYFHQRFGSKAKKCRPPCRFSKNDQGVQ